jgi:hypothetical protein
MSRGSSPDSSPSFWNDTLFPVIKDLFIPVAGLLGCIGIIGLLTTWSFAWGFASVIAAVLAAMLAVIVVPTVATLDQDGIPSFGRKTAAALAVLLLAALGATWIYYGTTAAGLVAVCVVLLFFISVSPDYDDEATIAIGGIRIHLGKPAGMMVVGYALWLMGDMGGIAMAMVIATIWSAGRALGVGSEPSC